MDNRQTGSLILRLRKERGLIQRALAEQLGVSEQAVSKWERGAWAARRWVCCQHWPGSLVWAWSGCWPVTRPPTHRAEEM